MFVFHECWGRYNLSIIRSIVLLSMDKQNKLTIHIVYTIMILHTNCTSPLQHRHNSNNQWTLCKIMMPIAIARNSQTPLWKTGPHILISMSFNISNSMNKIAYQNCVGVHHVQLHQLKCWVYANKWKEKYFRTKSHVK